jgi:hypothetical protein
MGDMQEEMEQEYGEEEDLELEEGEEISMVDVGIAVGKVTHGKVKEGNEISTEMIKAGGLGGY